MSETDTFLLVVNTLLVAANIVLVFFAVASTVWAIVERGRIRELREAEIHELKWIQRTADAASRNGRDAKKSASSKRWSPCREHIGRAIAINNRIVQRCQEEVDLLSGQLQRWSGLRAFADAIAYCRERIFTRPDCRATKG